MQNQKWQLSACCLHVAESLLCNNGEGNIIWSVPTPREESRKNLVLPIFKIQPKAFVFERAGSKSVLIVLAKLMLNDQGHLAFSIRVKSIARPSFQSDGGFCWSGVCYSPVTCCSQGTPLCLSMLRSAFQKIKSNYWRGMCCQWSAWWPF